MKVQFSNNANTVLNAPVEVGHAVMILASASKFPILDAGDWMYVTVEEEVVKVTNTSGNVFTCEEFTQPHPAGASVENRVTREVLEDAQDADIYDNAGDLPDVGTMRHGEMFVNTKDMQFGVGGETGEPLSMLAIRTHSAYSKYFVDDFVNYGGKLYACKVEHTASVFTSSMWKEIGGDTGGVVQELGIISGSVIIDVSTADIFNFSVSGALSVGFSGFVSPVGKSVLLNITNGDINVSWASTIKWPGGTAPPLSSAGRDKLIFSSDDGGTTVDAGVCGVGYA